MDGSRRSGPMRLLKSLELLGRVDSVGVRIGDRHGNRIPVLKGTQLFELLGALEWRAFQLDEGLQEVPSIGVEPDMAQGCRGSGLRAALRAVAIERNGAPREVKSSTAAIEDDLDEIGIRHILAGSKW